MRTQLRSKIFQASALVAWIVVHAMGIYVARVLWRPTVLSLPWVTYVMVFLSPFYILLVHRADIKWMLGGVLSTQRWYQARQGKQQHDVEPASDRERPATALQAITITTGFAALLAFQTVRFFRDLLKNDSPELFLKWLLMTIGALFVLACTSNLVQLQLHQLLAHPVWGSDQKKVFRRKLRFLRVISWHALLTSIVLTLCVLPYPWMWACYGVNFCYGLMLHRYYFSKPHPDFPTLGGDMVRSGATRETNVGPAPASRIARLGEQRAEPEIRERLFNDEQLGQKQPQAPADSTRPQSYSPGAWGVTLLTFAALLWLASRQSKN